MAENLGQVDIVIRDASGGGGGVPGGGGGGGVPGGGGGGGGAAAAAGGSMLGKVKGFITKHPIVVGALVALGTVTIAIKKVTKVLKSWDSEFDTMLKSFAAFNADIARYQAMRSVKDIVTTIQENKIFGQTTLELAKLKDQISSNLKPMKTMGNLFKANFLKVFYEDLEVATRVIKAFSMALLDWLQEHGETLGIGLRAIGSMSSNFAVGYGITKIGEAVGEMVEHLAEVRKMMRDSETREEIRGLNTDMLQSLELLSGGMWSVPNRNTNNSGSKRSPGSRTQGRKKTI